jgi:L-fuculose-phosphate aldolase
VEKHNAILLSNHGVVCWGDTVTHAEWSCEVLESYCWTLLVAAQMGAPIHHIAGEKSAELLAIKKRMGSLPDLRFEQPLANNGGGEAEKAGGNGSPAAQNLAPAELEALVKRVTREVLKQLEVK